MSPVTAAGSTVELKQSVAESFTEPLVEIDAPAFDLDLTLSCGQVFHWRRHGAGWLGTIGDLAAYAEQRDGKLLVSAAAQDAARAYFALDHPLAEIYATFPSDAAMLQALQYCRGMRIVRQPVWECLATFITSSMKQVAHIAQMSHALRRCFGERLPSRSVELFAYPTAERLARATEAELRQCSLGYRAKNLLATARTVAAGEIDLGAIATLDDDAALSTLCRFPGVGEKVAHCVLLFAYGRLRSFPIDVWIERVLRHLYFAGKRKVTARRLRAFSSTYFGPFGGYAQQYLFHHARMTWPRTAREKRKVPRRNAARPGSKTQRGALQQNERGH